MQGAFQREGEEAFLKRLSEFVRVVERDTTEHVKSLAYRLTWNLVMETPQYSGAAASAWRVGVGTPESVTEKPYYRVPDAGPGVGDKPYNRNNNRNMKAVNDALMLCSFEIGLYSLKAGDVWLTNGLDYAQWFPAGQHAPGKALRAVNLPQRSIPQIAEASLRPSSIMRY